MNDIINPMNFDITKNLHGHVRVETRDRWTGRVVDSQEKDNLVTNAVQALVAAQAWTSVGNVSTNAMFTDVLPIHTKALGGLLLFNGTLTASATNTAFPSSVKLVGCAGQTANSDSSIMGSLNTVESVYTSTGFTTTWDFLTSQANGTIASLARTSYRFISNLDTAQGINFALGVDASVTPTSLVRYLGYDSTNKYLYVGLSSATTIDGITYPTSNIYRIKADFDTVSLLQSNLPPISKWTSIKTLTSSDGSASATSFIYDQYDNNFAYVTGTTLHLVAIDGTHTTKTLTGTDGTLYVTENYYWRLYHANTMSSAATLYRIDKSNVLNVQEYPIGWRCLYPLGNDMFVATGVNNYSPKANVSYLYPDGTEIDLPTGSFTDLSLIHRVGNFLSNSQSLRFPSSYLGTIANLDSPVTKTSSQTMKITYTLTEA